MLIERSQDHQNSDRYRGYLSERRYCHYFANSGKCDFGVRSGRKCKFIHGKSPFCRSGINCNRTKCMYTHPKPHFQRPFLGHQQQTMNPWQAYPPGMTSSQHQPISNPWEQSMVSRRETTSQSAEHGGFRS